MAQQFPIEWTDATWNPITGCTKISPGCKFCYAERLSLRLQAMGQSNYRDGFELNFAAAYARTPSALEAPTANLREQHERSVPCRRAAGLYRASIRGHAPGALASISGAYQTIGAAAGAQPVLEWQPQIWMGVSIENEDYLFRIDHLRKTGAHIKFLSVEPLLGPLHKIDLRGIDWVIAGGESGPGARALDAEWVRELRDRCRSAGVPFFFKQWGGVFKSRTGRILDGRTWDEMPALSS